MGLPRSDFQPLSPRGGPPGGSRRPLQSKGRKILSNPNPRLHRAGALRRGAEAPRDPRDSRRLENRDLRRPASLLQAGKSLHNRPRGTRSLKEGARFPWRWARYVEFFFLQSQLQDHQLSGLSRRSISRDWRALRVGTTLSPFQACASSASSPFWARGIR